MAWPGERWPATLDSPPAATRLEQGAGVAGRTADEEILDVAIAARRRARRSSARATRILSAAHAGVPTRTSLSVQAHARDVSWRRAYGHLIR